MKTKHLSDPQINTVGAVRIRPVFGRIPRRCWLLLFFPLGLLCGWFARQYTELGERVFALGIYRAVSNFLSRVTGLLPFSLLEFGLIAIFIILVVLIVLFIRKIVKFPGHRLRVGVMAAINILCVLSAGYFVFIVLCGVNYARHPFSYYSGLELRPSSVEELDALCVALVTQATELRAQIPETAEGTARLLAKGYPLVADEARAAMEQLGERYDVLRGYYPRPKAIACSSVMSRLNLTGIYSPFTMEANVNVACPEYGMPSTMCHELSHLRGFMREDEANFIAYLACIDSGNAEFAYSGVMLALIHAGNQLFRQDIERYRTLRDSYSEGMMRDLAANNAYWAQYERTIISKVSSSVNDSYLKANRQMDGVESYGRMVDLLLAQQRSILEHREADSAIPTRP